jgi:tetratricopeptide (TPR) repeat protein
MATEALAVAQARGDALAVALAHRALGDVALRRGDYARARAAFAEDLARTRSLKDTLGVCIALESLGWVAVLEADYAEAEARYQEALALRRGLGQQQGSAATLLRLGEVAVRQERLAAARGHYQGSLSTYRALADGDGAAAALEHLAGLAAGEGRPEHALRLAGAAAALRATAGGASPAAGRTTGALSRPIGPDLQPVPQGEQAREGLSPEAQAVAWAAGQAMSLEQAVAYALEEPGDV